jgi:hypothetical protein
MSRLGEAPSIPVPQNKPMQRIRWRDWSGGYNSEDDPLDLPDGSSVEITNFNIDKRGKLVDIKGLSALLSNVPAGLSIERVFQYKVTKPSAQTITIVIGQVSSLWKVYAVNTTLFARPADVSGWRDLTEYVAAGAGARTATTNTVLDLGSMSQVANAQRGYYIINLTQGISSIVTDSVYDTLGLGLWDLTTANSLGGSPSDDILLMRYPLIGYYAPAGAATSYDLDVDDVNDISFLLDNEDLRINFGSSNDQERGLWFGYIDTDIFYAASSPADTTKAPGYSMAGWVCENQDLLRVTGESLVVGSTTTNDPPPVDTYYFKASYMYDGHQEGPPNTFDSGVQTVATSSGEYPYAIAKMNFFFNTLGATVTDESLYVQGGNISGAPMFMSYRMTDVLFYVSTDAVNFYLFENISLFSETSWPPVVGAGYTASLTNTKWVARGGEYSDRTGFGSMDIADASGVGSYPSDPKAIGYCDVQTMIRGRRIVGSMRQPVNGSYEQFVFRLAAAQPHSNGTWNNDVFGQDLASHIDIRTKQADAVMGLEELNSGLVVLKQNSLHYIDFGGGRMASWTMRVANDEVGCIAKRSVVSVPGGIIFAGKDNIYFFDGVNTVPIATPFKSDYQALSSKVNFQGAFFAKLNQYRMIDPNTGLVYIFNLQSKSWTLDSTVSSGSVNDLFSTPDGEILYTLSMQSYKMEQSGGIGNIAGTVKSPIVEFDKDREWMVKSIDIISKGTGNLTVTVYGNYGATSLGSFTITQTSALVQNRKRIFKRLDNIQIKVTTTSNSSYDTEINEISVTAVPIRKRRTVA